MPKRKTHKAAAKRIVITKNGKALKRTAGQGHFNAREIGSSKMNKRRDGSVAKPETRTMKKLMPYA